MSQTGSHTSTPEVEEASIDDLVRDVAAALYAGAPGSARHMVEHLRAPDLADVIELLEPEARLELILAFGLDFDFEVFSELDETVRDQLSKALPNDLLARAVRELDTDDAAYIIEGLEERDKEEVLAQLETSDRAALERNLEYPEETAGRLMQAHFVAVAPFWTVGQVID
ncbi:MAG: magnesium transporter MgtE N-terminal domain-containing protein, partial [Hyphomicrobium sp.]